MSYFSKFPKLVYDIKGNGNDALFTHILKRVKLHSAASANSKVFDYYQVVEGEKPEDIAHKYYGDANYHWVILLVNDITDRYHQWPMTVPQFEQFVADKYSNPNGLHHYEISQDSGPLLVGVCAENLPPPYFTDKFCNTQVEILFKYAFAPLPPIQ